MLRAYLTHHAAASPACPAHKMPSSIKIIVSSSSIGQACSFILYLFNMFLRNILSLSKNFVNSSFVCLCAKAPVHKVVANTRTHQKAMQTRVLMLCAVASVASPAASLTSSLTDDLTAAWATVRAGERTRLSVGVPLEFCCMFLHVPMMSWR